MHDVMQFLTDTLSLPTSSACYSDIPLVLVSRASQWHIARMTELPGHTMGACYAYRAYEQPRICTKRGINLWATSFVAIKKGSRRIFVLASAAEHAQQSKKQQYDKLHPLFCSQVGGPPPHREQLLGRVPYQALYLSHATGASPLHDS